jgi:NADH-quinone oxidoreductase subunit G
MFAILKLLFMYRFLRCKFIIAASFLGSKVGCAEVGIVEGKKRNVNKFVYAIGDAKIESNLSADFIVYQGHQGNVSALNADLILPGSAYTEKDSTFLNTEGRAQKTQKVLLAPGKAREDSSILSTIIELFVKDNVLEKSKCVATESLNTIKDSFFLNVESPSFECNKLSNKFLISNKINNFYLSDPISQAFCHCWRCLTYRI